MASLAENGQEYKCPFFKSARQMLQKASLKTRCQHNDANSDFSLKTLAAHFFKYIMVKRV
jgi:hypothetical protein